jgi:OmpA-OmpF porin, OOP family
MDAIKSLLHRFPVNSTKMPRTGLLLLAVLYGSVVSAQDAETKTNGNIAQVNVTVSDRKGKPSKGEQVVFKGQKTGRFFSGHSGSNGKFTLDLPIGETYLISVKSITDSAKYGTLDIPALGPDEFYTEPFKVDVKFEPAKVYTLDNVHFDVGKASLRPESYVELDELLKYLKSKDETKIEIGGHTDNVGKDADNLKLSQQRAETIRSYLVKKGIAPARVIAKGFGASQPVADNTTEQGRQLNRRTEVKLL